ncbi:MAG: hypothetical protein E2P02_16650 [Acidobacteria bacterium]|nr:MAG: hypothetical protein E2P02_16650 [Acidobacteriota bacterium]
MHSEHDTKNRDRILDFLGSVDRRLRRNDALTRLTQGSWGFVSALLFLKLTGLWSSTTARTVLLVLAAAGIAAWVVWNYLKRRSLSRSAVVADRGADLKDALKSALAFLGLEKTSEWMELQIARSADAASELSPAEMAPTVVPTNLYYASGIGVVLFTLFSWNPGWFQELQNVDYFSATLGQEEEALEELLDQAEALAPEEEKLEELSEALDRLRRRDIELSQSLQELSEAQEALAASQVDMERLSMDLEELAAQLESSAALADLAEALKNQNTEEAAKLLRELAERLANAETSEELQALLEALQGANVQNQELAEMMENLQQAAGDLSPEDLAKMAQSLEAMAEQLEKMGQQMAQQDADQMGQEMQQLQASMGQQQAGEQQSGQQQEASGQAMQSAQGMMSNQMQMAQMQGDPGSAVPVDAGPAGDTTGPGGGGDEQVFGEATSLEVQLALEMLAKEDQEEPIPEEIFERLSREEKSTLNYEVIQQRSDYAEESAMEREGVPWQYRSLVKRYFLSILTQTETSPDP